MAQDPQAQQGQADGHAALRAAAAASSQMAQAAHGMMQKAQSPPQAHPEIMQALQQLQQGQQQGGQQQGGGLPDPAALVAQDPQQAVMYADAILHAVSQHIMAQGAPAGPSVPVPPPNVGGAHSGF